MGSQTYFACLSLLLRSAASRKNIARLAIYTYHSQRSSAPACSSVSCIYTAKGIRPATFRVGQKGSSSHCSTLRSNWLRSGLVSHGAHMPLSHRFHFSCVFCLKWLKQSCSRQSCCLTDCHLFNVTQSNRTSHDYGWMAQRYNFCWSVSYKTAYCTWFKTK